MMQPRENYAASKGLPLLILLWLAGLYLRIPILVAPPLAPSIAADLGLSQAITGALTTLPVLMLAIGAMPGSLAIARLGPRATLALALVVVAVGSGLRAVSPNAAMLLIASAIMGLGIAAMQPALPALLRIWLSPQHLALGTAVYMNGMLVGEFTGAGTTLPLVMPLTGNSWQWALVVWSLPALLIAALLFLPRAKLPASGIRPAWIPDWRHPMTWRIGVLLGASGAMFFGTNAYMASLLEQRGELATLGNVLFWFNLAQVVASLILLKTAKHWVGRPDVIVITLISALVSLALFLVTSGALSIIFAFVMSLTAGVMLILLVALPPRVAASADTGRLAAGNFTIGYILSFTVPMLGGLVADATGQAWHAIAMIIVYGLITLPVAITLKLPDSQAA